MIARFASHRPARVALRILSVLACHVVLLTTLFLVWDVRSTRALTKADTGKWTPNSDWRSTNDVTRHAIHMALVRGDNNPYHSRILWWSGDASGFFGGCEWGWKTGGDGCDSFPQASRFTEISVPSSNEDVFCSGQAALADGRMLSAGGADSATGDYGDDQTRVWRTGTGSGSGAWTNSGAMKQWRWYATVTTLADGRMLVLSGDRSPHHRIFGGARNDTVRGSPMGDSLYRFLPVTYGHWDPSVIPLADDTTGRRPPMRQGHSSVEMEKVSNIEAHAFFGGRDTSGVPLSELWFLTRQNNLTGDDYTYKWQLINRSGGPTARSHHSAVNALADSAGEKAGMYLWGGRTAFGLATTDQNMYRLHGLGGPHWVKFLPSGTAPSARFAHTAIFDSIHINADTSLKNRMIVFGGIASDGQTPSDLGVWEMRLDSTNFSVGAWHRLSVVAGESQNRRPAPRYGHATVWDQGVRHNSYANKNGHVGFMFGGQLGASAFSDTLWALWVFNDNTVAWEPKFFSGPAPSARARFGMVLDPNQGFVNNDQHSNVAARLYICGGDNASDDSVYVVDPWTSSPTWSKWASPGFHLSGQSVTLDKDDTRARTPEVYDSTSGWQSILSTSTLLQNTYPPTFLIRGGNTSHGRILSVGSDLSTYYLDVATSGAGNAWTKLTNGDLGFNPEAGVLYQPNKIMVAGGLASGSSLIPVGTTKTLDDSVLTNSWQTSATSGPQLVPRVYTNLVLLPGGKVIAVGGDSNDGTHAYSDNYPARRPQIWDPAGNSGTGSWTDTTLDRQPTMRNYHSTAVLLPDGRVLSASGDAQSDEYYANLYCPPYLFNGDNLATRPVITDVVQRVRCGQKFAVCLPSGTYHTTACLIRPGMTTHAFDENQRYYSLAAADTANDGSWVEYSMPSDSTNLPPGDYLFFVMNPAKVPAVAKWVRVGPVWSSGDTTRPSTISDLSVDVSSHSIIYSWTAPGDDGSSGQAAQYEMRYSTSPITTSNFHSATAVPNMPVPHCSNSTQFYQLSGLSSCTWYYLGITTGDESGNVSGGLATIGVKTMCGGGGGGSATQAPGMEPIGAEGSAIRTAEAGGNSPSHTHSQVSPSRVSRLTATAANATTGGSLIAEYHPDGSGARWDIRMVAPGEVGAFSGADTAGLLIQSRNDHGDWQSRYVVRDPESFTGLGRLREGERVVFAGSYALNAIEAAPPGFDLTRAVHSRLGSLDANVADPTPFSVDMSAGDTLYLGYQPAAGDSATNEDCFFVVRRLGSAGPANASHHPTLEPAPSRPLTFALHQNEPNPFASVTMIRFDLPVGEMVKIEAFDASGRRVATIANRFFVAGYHRVEWNPRASSSGFGPGVYFYRIQAGPFRARMKAVLLP